MLLLLHSVFATGLGGWQSTQVDETTPTAQIVIQGWRSLESQCSGAYSAEIEKTQSLFMNNTGKRIELNSVTRYFVRSDGVFSLLDTELVKDRENKKDGFRSVVCKSPKSSFVLSRLGQANGFQIDFEEYDGSYPPNSDGLLEMRSAFLRPASMNLIHILARDDYEISEPSRVDRTNNLFNLRFRHRSSTTLSTSEMTLESGSLVVDRDINWAIRNYELKFSNKSQHVGEFKYTTLSPLALDEVNDKLSDISGANRFGETTHLRYRDISFDPPPAKSFTMEYYGVNPKKRGMTRIAWIFLATGACLIALGYKLLRKRAK
ncbi:hypothetical protein [Pirellula sp. SH-Sr6A]|uniref:hypothetical protein n=1 Tax=Pirellula sp. SH-Sr6A TaxID=1632865 RepID=UPI00197BBF2E|nr:hypothetical protein [Pirellula sp. SH-Sr6A]